MNQPSRPASPPPVSIGDLRLSPPFGIAPMAGLTDSAFRRLAKRLGGCGLVTSEMVSSEGIIRGGDRTREYLAFTDEERPVAIQIFGGDPGRMAEAAAIVAGQGADLVDVNMGCPVPKIANHESGCSLMREPERAERIVAAMVRRAGVPITVKMRTGWNERDINAPELARRLEGAGAAAITVHGRTAAQSYRGDADWTVIGRVASAVSIPVFGNGDLVEPSQVLERMRQSGVGGVLVGRGVVRNPWMLAQATDLAEGREPRCVGAQVRRDFLLEYIELLTRERVRRPGRHHRAAAASGPWESDDARGHDRWVINKLRALTTWFSKGLDGGSHFRADVNQADSLAQLREVIDRFFAAARPPEPDPPAADTPGGAVRLS